MSAPWEGGREEHILYRGEGRGERGGRRRGEGDADAAQTGLHRITMKWRRDIKGKGGVEAQGLRRRLVFPFHLTGAAHEAQDETL